MRRGGYPPGAEVGMKGKTMKQKILFFISAPNPTDAELAAAEKIGTTAFRYAGAIRPVDTLEKCDAVAGDPDVIPESYKAAFPVAPLDKGVPASPSSKAQRP